MNESPQHAPGSDDELNWLAFRYVAGELTEEETESFEARLADDLAACEAVASMTELSINTQTALVSDKLEPARRVEDPRSLPVRLRSWLAVGSAIVALGWLFMLFGDGKHQDVAEFPGSSFSTELQSAADLIAHWSQSDDEVPFYDELLEIVPIELGGDESETPDIPGWMIAAVTLENAGSPADDMPDLPSDRNPVETKEN